MFANHKIVTAVGSVGAALVLAHVVLGPDIVPPSAGVPGAFVAAASGLYLVMVNKRDRARSEGSSERGPR